MIDVIFGDTTSSMSHRFIVHPLEILACAQGEHDKRIQHVLRGNMVIIHIQ